MKVFKTVQEIEGFVNRQKTQQYIIGFVPTMGALHKGHTSLIQEAKNRGCVAICSIYVNPKQFNNKADLDSYPITIEDDIQILEKNGCDAVFIPSNDEIYPKETRKVFDFSPLDQVMEGIGRPGHFNGVGLVVERLFDIIKPNYTFFGKKDFQQLAIVKHLVKSLNLDVNVVACPTIREVSGLAMSSRNTRLSPNAREQAAEIYKALKYTKQNTLKKTVKELKEEVERMILSNPLFKLEYFEIADGNLLQPIHNWEDANFIVAFIAVEVEGVRLLDNITLIG